MIGDQAEIDGVGPKSVTQEAFLGRGYGIRFPLKDGQGTNKGENLGNIRWSRGPNRGCHASILGPDDSYPASAVREVQTGRTV